MTSERHVALSVPELVESFLGVSFTRAIRNNDAGNGKIVLYMFIIFAALKLHVHLTWYINNQEWTGKLTLPFILSPDVLPRVIIVNPITDLVTLRTNSKS